MERFKEEAETNFDGSNAKSTGLEKQTDTAGGDPFPETANYSTRYQYVLHFPFSYLVLEITYEKKKKKNNHLSWENRREQSRTEQNRTEQAFRIINNYRHENKEEENERNLGYGV